MIEILMDNEIPEDMKPKMLWDKVFNRLVRNWLLGDDEAYEAMKILRSIR